ncbi:MAG TPA: hypothetical protein VMW72_09325 [Sedimentisphaerales bacterium]|nr:hypothetical protein [Sedimentisphaerales bacterium]
MIPPSAPKKQTQFKPSLVRRRRIPKGQNELRAYPNNRVVMRPSEKFEAKAAGQKCSEAWFSPRRERFWPTTQASGFAAGRNRAGYLDRLLTSLAGKSGHTPAYTVRQLFDIVVLYKYHLPIINPFTPLLG